MFIIQYEEKKDVEFKTSHFELSYVNIHTKSLVKRWNNYSLWMVKFFSRIIKFSLIFSNLFAMNRNYYSYISIKL